MNNTRQTYWLSFGKLNFLVAICALVLASVASQVSAQSSVQFEIGESARLLRASLDLQNGDISQVEFDAIKMTETCKSPSARLQDRNRPWMMVWNTSAAADDVATVTVDLTESGFEFGDGDVPGDGFAGLLSMLSSSQTDAGVSLDSAVYGSDTTELELNFSGLSQGLAAIFRVDIDEPGGIAMFPDFREAMLGADTGGGPGQRATMTADFTSGATTISMFPQAAPLSSSGVAEAYHGQTMSMVVPSTVIPEPTSIALLLAGVAGIVAMRRSR